MYMFLRMALKTGSGPLALNILRANGKAGRHGAYLYIDPHTYTQFDQRIVQSTSRQPPSSASSS